MHDVDFNPQRPTAGVTLIGEPGARSEIEIRGGQISESPK
jgi:hypothetical protein